MKTAFCIPHTLCVSCVMYLKNVCMFFFSIHQLLMYLVMMNNVCVCVCLYVCMYVCLINLPLESGGREIVGELSIHTRYF